MVSLTFSKIKPEDIIYQATHYYENDSRIITVITSVFFVLTLLLVILRLVTRRIRHIKYRIEDFLIVAALVLALGLWIEALLAVKYGAGQHSLRVFRELGMSSIVASLKILFALEITYILSHLLIKTSILFLYRTIFTFVLDSFRCAWYAIFVYVVLNAIVSIIMVLIQCRPLSYSWEEPLGVSGSCINLKANHISNGGTTAFADLLLLLLPMPVFRALRLPKKQKMALYLLFALGFLALSANIVRLVYLGRIANSVDFTYIEVNPFIWSIIEVDLGIICACIPTVKPLFKWRKDNCQLSNPILSGDMPSSGGWKSPQQASSQAGTQTSHEELEMQDAVPNDSHTDIEISSVPRTNM